jgi:lysophospholipid acyltransferase (LPLAT)-like uncharacterized protein
VREQNNQVYQFASLSNYPLTKRILIRLLDLVFFSFIKILGRLSRFETQGFEHYESIVSVGNFPILAVWHDRILLSGYFWQKRGIAVLISQSLDGEAIARSSQRLGYGVIRGSSSRGGARALADMVRCMENGLPMSMTVDGPRGPRYEAKMGSVSLAKKTGNPILPFVIEPKKVWTLNSWDRMQIPKPLSRVVAIIGQPIYVAKDASDAEVEAKLGELQTSLNDLVERGKAWRGRLA